MLYDAPICLNCRYYTGLSSNGNKTKGLCKKMPDGIPGNIYWRSGTCTFCVKAGSIIILPSNSDESNIIEFRKEYTGMADCNSAPVLFHANENDRITIQFAHKTIDTDARYPEFLWVVDSYNINLYASRIHPRSIYEPQGKTTITFNKTGTYMLTIIPDKHLTADDHDRQSAYYLIFSKE